MVDFRKKLGKKEVEKKIIPLDIYNELDRRSITGPLRPAKNKSGRRTVCFRLSQYISITTSSSRSYKIWNTILLN